MDAVGWIAAIIIGGIAGWLCQAPAPQDDAETAAVIAELSKGVL